MRYIDCVYRAHLESEIILGKYDIANQCILGAPELMKFPLTKYYKIHDAMYEASKTMHKSTLVDVMCKHPKSYLVINYGNIGTIIVYQSSVVEWCFGNPTWGEVATILNPLLYTEHKILGVVKSKVLTYTSAQPYAKLVAVKCVDGIERVYSNHGIYTLDCELDEYTKLDLPAYTNMLKDGNSIFGLACSKGKSVYLYRDEENKTLYIGKEVIPW